MAIGLILLLNQAFSQNSKVFDNLSFKSSILNGERKYAIYLPEGYETSLRSYPVLYLLHGSGDDHTAWVQFGEIHNIADKAIAEGKATPVIIVMPDANTGQRGYFNSIKGNWQYEDFFFQEFLPYIEKTYRIKTNKQYRAIAGLSMGGGGTLMYALHHPELFSSACPLSANVGPLTIEDAKKKYMKDGVVYPDTLIEKYLAKHNAISLVNSIPVEQTNSIRWYIDCGDDDYLYEGNSLLHIAMRKKEISHEYRVRDGAHNWTFWRQSLPEVLWFVSSAFHQF